jgi:hypothetical protein
MREVLLLFVGPVVLLFRNPAGCSSLVSDNDGMMTSTASHLEASHDEDRVLFQRIVELFRVLGRR